MNVRRWKADELVELVRMVGIISAPAQAKMLECSEWSRKATLKRYFNVGKNTRLHGLSRIAGQDLVSIDAEYLYVNTNLKSIYLWVEIERCLKAELPTTVHMAVSTLADFQRWLFKSDDVMTAVKQMIKEREVWDEA